MPRFARLSVLLLVFGCDPGSLDLGLSEKLDMNEPDPPAEEEADADPDLDEEQEEEDTGDTDVFDTDVEPTDTALPPLTFASANAPIAIFDNAPSGVVDTIVVPDFGTVSGVSVSVDVRNSDVSKLTVAMADPLGNYYLLYDRTQTGTLLALDLPKPDPPLMGDLTAVSGQNPAGNWRIHVVDTGFYNGSNDGELLDWRLSFRQ